MAKLTRSDPKTARASSTTCATAFSVCTSSIAGGDYRSRAEGSQIAAPWSGVRQIQYYSARMSPDSPAHAGPATGDDGGPAALTPVDDLAAALGGLTCLPLPRPDPRSAAFGRSTLFFPLVGLGIGALLLALHRLLVLLLPRWLAAVG